MFAACVRVASTLVFVRKHTTVSVTVRHVGVDRNPNQAFSLWRSRHPLGIQSPILLYMIRASYYISLRSYNGFGLLSGNDLDVIETCTAPCYVTEYCLKTEHFCHMRPSSSNNSQVTGHCGRYVNVSLLLFLPFKVRKFIICKTMPRDAIPSDVVTALFSYPYSFQ